MNQERRQALIEEHTTSPRIEFRQRSIFIRHLDCGSCNGCEIELNALTNPIYDMVQYGIHFEASPRHADVLVMTGPYTRNLDAAARATLAAMPVARVITIGDCAKDGGDFKNSYAVREKPEEFIQAVKAHIPGCPPSPTEILHSLMNLKLDQERTASVREKLGT